MRWLLLLLSFPAFAQEPEPPLVPCSCSAINNTWVVPGRILNIPGKVVVSEMGATVGEVMGKDRAVWVLMGKKMENAIREYVRVRTTPGYTPTNADWSAEKTMMRGLAAELDALRK